MYPRIWLLYAFNLDTNSLFYKWDPRTCPLSRLETCWKPKGISDQPHTSHCKLNPTFFLLLEGSKTGPVSPPMGGDLALQTGESSATAGSESEDFHNRRLLKQLISLVILFQAGSSNPLKWAAAVLGWDWFTDNFWMVVIVKHCHTAQCRLNTQQAVVLHWKPPDYSFFSVLWMRQHSSSGSIVIW